MAASAPPASRPASACARLARDLGRSPSWLLSVEAGENGIDAVRLADLGRYLGYPASYFLDEPDYVVQRQRQLMSRPATRLDWQLMYDGEGEFYECSLADHFASHLLVPRAWLALAGHPTAAAIARRCGVSRAAAASALGRPSWVKGV